LKVSGLPASVLHIHFILQDLLLLNFLDATSAS